MVVQSARESGKASYIGAIGRRHLRRPEPSFFTSLIVIRILYKWRRGGTRRAGSASSVYRSIFRRSWRRHAGLTPGTRRAWERHGLELMKLPDDVKLTALKSGSERSLPGSFGLSPQMVIVRHPGYHAQRLSFPNPNWGLHKVVPAPVPCYVSLVRYGQLYSRFFYSSSLPTAGWFVATMDDYVRTCMCGAPRGRESAARDRPIDMCSRLSALVCPRAVNGDVCVCLCFLL